MQLVYATTNPSKLNMMTRFLQPLNIHVIGLDGGLPTATESGNQPLDNARQKAKEYFSLLQKPLFSCDSGLFFEGVPAQLQPGVNVRNVNGKCLSDDEMIEYYSKLACKYGHNGQLICRYKNAICLILNKDTVVEYDGEELSGERFVISSVPHAVRKQGFPIDSLSIHLELQQYYYDLTAQHRGFSMEKGFQNFFAKVLQQYNAMLNA